MVKRKLSRRGLTVKTLRLHAYPGDTLVQVRVVNERGATVLVFNIWPKTRKGVHFWNNDRFGEVHRSITEAKEWALQKALSERKGKQQH